MDHKKLLNQSLIAKDALNESLIGPQVLRREQE